MSNLPSNRMLSRGSYWQAADAVVCGDVEIGAESSLWFGCVVRGDVAPIRIGVAVNVQEHCVLHCDSGEPLIIGDRVTIGHGAVVHCLKVGAGSLIGIKAVVLGRVEIGKDCMVAAGAVVSPGTVVPDGHVVMGVPAKVVRPLREAERQHLAENNAHYIRLAAEHAQHPERFYR